MDQKKVSWILKEREDKSSRYFDKIGKQWDRIQSEVLNPQVYRNWILHNLPNRSDLILDLGCGPGGMISDLLSRANKVIGIDTSSKMIEAASASFLKNKKVNFIEASLEDLPISKTSANVVVASMVLHHISNPPLVLFEANRVLKSGGTLILVDIKKHDKEFMRDKYADLWLGFDSSLLNEWLEGAGFTVTESSELSTNSDFVLLTIKANKKKGGLNVRSNSK
jgi:ArsR family transcriptional regulator